MKFKFLVIGLAVLILPFSAMSGKDNVFGGVWMSSNDGDVALPGEGREGACMGSVDEFFVMTHGYATGLGDSGHVRIYDTENDFWFTGASSPNARSEGVGAAYGGFVYCIGGRVEALVERYDFGGNSWSEMAPMGVARGGPAAAVYEYHTGVFELVLDVSVEVLDPRIYVFGGRDGGAPFSGSVLNSAEVYDIKTDAWSAIAPPPTPVSDARAVTKGGNIYLIGGAVTGAGQVASPILQIYDPQTDTWEAGPDMSEARANHAAASIGNTIYVMGGFDATGVTLDTAEAFDVDKGEWAPWIAEKPNTCNETHAVRVANKLYVFGSGAGGAAENYFDVFSRK
jgi:kelch-like protein 18